VLQVYQLLLASSTEAKPTAAASAPADGSLMTAAIFHDFLRFDQKETGLTLGDAQVILVSIQ
jgi:hypothetical protein